MTMISHVTRLHDCYLPISFADLVDGANCESVNRIQYCQQNYFILLNTKHHKKSIKSVLIDSSFKHFNLTFCCESLVWCRENTM